MNDLLLKLKILNEFWKMISGGKTPQSAKPVKVFEKKLAEFCGAEYALGVASGTDALILSLKALGVGPGDEVIVPAVSFFSTAGAAAWLNAKPVFVDVELDSFNIAPDLIEKAVTPKTKGIIVTHLNGRMAEMEKISAIAKKRGLFLIEDAAQALGAKYKNHHPGYYGDIACLSFNPSKILTGFGDGGAIVTNNKNIAEKISLLRMYGTTFENLSNKHSIVGVASRLSPFHAAVMNVVLDDFKSLIEKRRNNYFLYSELLQEIARSPDLLRKRSGLLAPSEPYKDLILLKAPQDYFINGCRYVILTKKRDELHKFLRENKIDSRIQYGVPLPYFEAFGYLGYKKGDFPVAEKIAEESLVLPTDSKLSEKEIRRTAELVKKFFVENST